MNKAKQVVAIKKALEYLRNKNPNSDFVGHIVLDQFNDPEETAKRLNWNITTNDSDLYFSKKYEIYKKVLRSNKIKDLKVLFSFMTNKGLNQIKAGKFKGNKIMVIE